MTVNGERDLPDTALPDAPPVDGPVVAYLRGLLANPDVAPATKVVVIVAHQDDATSMEYIGLYYHGVTFTERLGLLEYQAQRTRDQVSEED